MVKTFFCLILVAGLCKGAPISKELDPVYLLSNADYIISALGGMRVKRDADYDKEFVIEKYGLGLGLSYKDRSDKAGKFYFKLKDTRFDVAYDLVQKDEGFYTVDLVIEWEGNRKVITVSRKQLEDGQFYNKLVLESGDLNLFLEGNSDFETVGKFIMKYEYKGDEEVKTRSEDIKIDVFHDKNRQLKFEVWRNGRYYSVDINGNIPEFKGNIDIQTPERNYNLEGRATIKGDWKIQVKGNVKGQMSFLMLMKKDYSEAKLELNHKGKKMVQMKIKNEKMDDNNAVVKAKWALLGGKFAKGDMDSTYSNGKLDIELKPFNRPVINFHGFFLPEYKDEVLSHLNFGFDSKRGGNQIVKYSGELFRISNDAVHDTKFVSDLDVTKDSLIHKGLCKLGEMTGGGCFLTRKMEVETHVEKQNTNLFVNKYKLKIKNVKDDHTDLDVDINSLGDPYTFKIVTPLLTSALETDTFLITSSSVPGKGFTVESNLADTKFSFNYGDESQDGLKGKGYHAELRNEGETNMKYDLFAHYEKNENVNRELKMRSNLFVTADTKIHQALCKLEAGCFTTRTAVLDMTADLTGKTPKWDFAIDIANDGASVFKSDFVTAEAGGVLSGKLTSSHPDMESVTVDITLATADTEVLINGKKEFDVILTPQKSLDTKDGWTSNDVGFQCSGPETIANGNINWSEDGRVTYSANGNNKMMGRFSNSRELKVSDTEKGFHLELKENRDTSKGILVEGGWNPLMLDVDLDVQTDIINVNGSIEGSYGSGRNPKTVNALVENSILVFV